MVLRGGRVVDPSQGWDGPGDLYLAEGRVAALLPAGSPLPPGFDAAEARDCRGLLVTPGAVDTCAALGLAGDPWAEDPETFAAAAAAGGFATVLASVDRPDPELVAWLARGQRAVRILPVVPALAPDGSLADLGRLAEAGAVGVGGAWTWLEDARAMRRVVEYAREVGLVVVVRPLEAALARGGVAHEGMLSFALGLRGIPRAAETVAVQRDVTLAEAFGGRVHFAALSAREAVAAVRGPATAGTTAYHLLLTEDAVRGYDTRAKLDPPLREEADRAALVEAVRRRRLVVASGHRPCREEAKLCEYDYAEFGASALEVALAAALEVLEPPEFAWAVAAGPAEAFGLPGGTLRPGAPADVSVFDPEARWVVEPEAFVSRGRSTPLGGRALRARPVLTVVGGRVVFEAEKECINMQSK